MPRGAKTTAGAAQMAAILPLCTLSKSPRAVNSWRLVAPGIPPGSMSHSEWSKSASLKRRSASTVIPWAPATLRSAPIDTVLISMPARRITSTTVRASISSNPSARKINERCIILRFRFRYGGG